MKAKKLSRGRRAALMAALTLPVIFGFNSVEAAREVSQPFEEENIGRPAETTDIKTTDQTPAVTQKVETPAETTKVEAPAETTKVEAPAETAKVEAPAETAKVEAPAETAKVETPAETTKVETPAETAKVETPAETAKVETPAETQKVETPAVTPTAQTPPPRNFEPPPEPYRSQVDSAILEYYKQFEGKTIVDIAFDGASSDTLPTVKAAVIEHVGDAFNAMTALRDRNALMNTGYFYEAYQSFEVIPEGIVITFHVMENPVLKDVVFTGNTIYDDLELQDMLTVRRGFILNNNTLHDNIAKIQEEYHDEGFILMKVTDMNMDENGVLTLKINEGILEGYAVKGNKKTKDKVILREMRQEVGTPFNAKLARRSMQRVYNLGFFEDVNLKMNPGVEPNAIIMEVDVKEKRTGTLGLGAGYSTADGIIGMISIGDTNFHGIGDAVNLIYEKSGDETDAHGYNFSYRHPWLDRHETAVRFQIYNRTYAYNDYDTRGHFKEEYMRKYSGGEFTFSRPISEYSTNFITFRHRKDKYVRHVSKGNMGDRSGPDFADWRHDNFGTTRSIILEHVTDTRDNIYMPTEGNKVDLSLEVGGLIGGDFDYQKASIEHQYYFKAGDHDQVWALRGMVGYGRGDMTEFTKFRLGGQGTLRGYRDDQFRGDRMILGTLEYRFPLAKKIQGAIFTDWGSAWDSGLKPKNVKGSVGFGVALNTPMGPLRLDYGRGSQGGRFHFSVGTSF